MRSRLYLNLAILALSLFLPHVALGYPPCVVDMTLDDETYNAIAEQRFEDAAKLLQKPAADGNVEAQYLLANRYLHGSGVAKDTDRAIDLYTQAAKGGCVTAQSDLGLYYADQGRYEAAFPFLLAAAESGMRGWSTHLLGLMYEKGLGAPRDPQKGECWRQKATELPRAQPEHC
ncbi:tetratricopeptide repeat protein [Dongia rigui]|uniref:Tetratricopeptide repeat protein n=1 Tax=Dongia rigui TaxID=940149 RepID=A0ABU5E3A5_9PROT|nr:tetratricopeptide repeat protein [Dongia rigui]MDY0874003.1 tetratricopeptide repeat protein [Dongia rigui]